MLVELDSYSSQEYFPKVQEFERPLFRGLESPRKSMRTRQGAKVAAGNVVQVSQNIGHHSQCKRAKAVAASKLAANEINQ